MPYAPAVLAGVLDTLGIRPALLIHNLHNRGRWSQGSVLVESAEILTWAERGMPLNEHCRTPLCPNSDQGRIAPGLTFLAVHQARYTIYRSKILMVAWTLSGWRRNDSGRGPETFSLLQCPSPYRSCVIYSVGYRSAIYQHALKGSVSASSKLV